MARGRGEGLFPIAPEPAEGVGEFWGHAFAAMETLGPFEMMIVVVKGEGFGDEFVGGGPVAEGVVEVILPAEKINAEGFWFGEANDGGVGVAAADIGEAADPREDFAELVGAFPSGGEGADASGGTACEGDVLGLGAPIE